MPTYSLAFILEKEQDGEEKRALCDNSHRFAFQPESPIQQDAVVGFFDFVELFSRSFALLFLTFDTEALLSWIDAAEDLIPQLEIESRVIGLVLDRDGVMEIVLKGRVDDRMMSIGIGKLVAPVQIDAIAVEEGRKLNDQCLSIGSGMNESHLKEEQIHVDREESWEDDERQRSDKLIDVFIGDDGERCWVVELMMGLVDVPAGIDGVTHSMVEELEEICGQPNDKETDDQIRPTESAETTVTLKFPSTHQMQGESGTKGGREETFEHHDDFRFHSTGRWIFGIGFLLPFFEGNLHIVIIKNDRREEDQEEQGDDRQRDPR